MTFQRELELTADRLRHLPDSRLAPHADAVYALLDRMTDRPVPRVRPQGWGDQVIVVGREVPLDRHDGLGLELRELRRRFDLTI